MKVYDRYTGRQVDVDKLPSQIDLGRFFIPETNEDLTNRIINVGSDKMIRQEVLENDNKSIQGLFCQFHQFVNNAETDSFTVKPIIQSVKNKLFLNEFEAMLKEKLFHLEEIFRQPHYLLQRTIEKVNVSRAKRIPAKSYQNLASHTEDWLHKSIVDFKPRRILNEELDLLYDVYENQVTVALIERCLLYLNSRIKEVHDIKDFLEDYSKMLSARDDRSGWYQKIERNLTLIGDVYEDNNYHREEDRSSILAKTQAKLQSMQKRLKALQGTSFYDEVNIRAVQSLMTEFDISPTNVIANHKHYRYVRELWRELNKVDLEQSEVEKNNYEQEVISGIRCYSKALISYIVKDVLGYKISGTYSKWDADSFYFCSISMSEENGILLMKIGHRQLKIVTVANDCRISESDMGNNGLIVLSLGSTKRSGRIISISPYEADSVERVGRVIREYILRDYLDKINKKFLYPQILKGYVKYVNCQYINFFDDYTYSFNGIPQTDVSETNVVKELETDDIFNRRSRPDKDEIRKIMREFVEDINTNAKRTLSLIECQNIDCHAPFSLHDAMQLDYLACSCGFVLDSTGGHVIFKNKDERFNKLKPEDWGMDYVEFDMN